MALTSRLKVMCLSSLTDPVLSLSGTETLIATLAGLLRGRGLIDKVELESCNAKELQSTEGYLKY